jgi:outer membrane protein W
MVTGDFKFSGFDYTLDGDDVLAQLDVSYTVTDTDADSVSGAISIDIGNDLNTLIVPDTNDNGV